MTPEIEAQAESAAAELRRAAPQASPRLGLVLGSGLGGLVADLEDATAVPYDRLPGFPRPGVGGHDGQLVLGLLGGLPVAVLQGRAHPYETGRADAMAVPIWTLQALGCQAVVLTNAAGSLREEMRPGAVMLVTDHINFAGLSPLVGAAGDERFVDMTAAYDPGLCQALRAAAGAVNVLLHEGTYIWFLGPQFETPAEIRAAAALGADAVGMSTVPEVILARRAGLAAAALSIITNPAAGLGEGPLSHRQTQAVAAKGAEAAGRILICFAAARAQAGPLQ